MALPSPAEHTASHSVYGMLVVVPAHPHRLQEGDERLVCLPSHFCQLQVELDDLPPAAGLQRGAKQRTGGEDSSRLCASRLLPDTTERPSHLETEAGLVLSLGDGRQLQEVTTDDQLDAPERLR